MAATNYESQRAEPELDIVICTYDNPVLLDLALTALADQKGAGDGWNVTVVDNNSDVETRDVVSRHALQGRIPGLRRIEESTQGLTPARLRGVRSTSARWIAFVDDDCVLDERWVERALAFASAHSDCGGFGGRVTPEFASHSSSIPRRYGWVFAEQAAGDEPVTVGCLVGAGMVLNRTSLEKSGWTDRPFFADRVGQRLVSGGDVEMALRVAATGRPLWYEPRCSLRHLIPKHRTEPRYLARMACGIGVSFSLAQALIAPQAPRPWLSEGARDLMRSTLRLRALARKLFEGSDGRLDALLSSSYELGRWLGFVRVAWLIATRTCDFFGQAQIDGDIRSNSDNVVRPS